MITHYFSRQKCISFIVLCLGVVCFFLWWIALLTHEQLFTSWRLLDWLIFALPMQFFLSLLGVTKQKKQHIWYIFLSVSCLLIIITFLNWYISLRTFFLSILRWGTGRYIYRRQRQWLLNRCHRSTRWFIWSQVAVWWSCISFLTTVWVISTIWNTGINCNQIEDSLRLSWIQGKIDISTLGGFLWASSLPEDASIAAQTWSTTWLLWFLSLIKGQIYDLIIEQQGMLNNSLCELVNKQLTTIQDRPWWQVAWVVLVYIIMRPLVVILVRVCMPIWVLARKLLIHTGLIRKQKKRVLITWLILE